MTHRFCDNKIPEPEASLYSIDHSSVQINSLSLHPRTDRINRPNPIKAKGRDGAFNTRCCQFENNFYTSRCGSIISCRLLGKYQNFHCPEMMYTSDEWPSLITCGYHLHFLQICVAIYNVFFHPLCKFPGSKWWAMSRVPYVLMVWSGDEHKQVLRMHQRYGEVVRLAPDELSFLTPQAWDDVMGHRKAGQEENGKEACYSGSMGNSIVASKRADHVRLRRVLSYGFSAQSMLKQEPIIRKYVDLFMKRLHEVSADNKPVNIMRWYNFCTFDIVGDLAFGEPFDCLTKSDFHPWVAIIFDSIKFMAISIAMKHFPLIYGILERCIPRDIREKDEQRRHFSHQKVLKRIDSGIPRPDFTESMISRKDDQVRP